MSPTIESLYLAYRQAKLSLFFEKRGVGSFTIAKYEDSLRPNILRLRREFSVDHWFDGPIGDPYVVPKRLRSNSDGDEVTRIGIPSASQTSPDLDVQTRLAPHPDFSIREVLYFWKFGVALENLLADESVGYRLDIRNGVLSPTRRWLFEYWPAAYQRFRIEPVTRAKRALREGDEIVVLTADLASFYDTIDPSFMVQSAFVNEVELAAQRHGTAFSRHQYEKATRSLLAAFGNYRNAISRGLGIELSAGVPIGALTSRLVANLALATLDAHIGQQSDVICYRRYVDDIIVVARHDGSSRRPSKQDILRKFFPLRALTSGVASLDIDLLRRGSSEFYLQDRKVNVHHLAGAQGLDFLDAVGTDFTRVLSEGRSFVDVAAVLEDGVSHLIRVNAEEGSPLRVLRDADRARLERYSLNAALRSFERVADLVDPAAARRQIRATLERVGRVLDADENWTDNIDVSFRLLKLAVLANDWESARELVRRMDSAWATVEALRSTVGSLFSKNSRVNPDRKWPWAKLRDYLHTRRIEAICSALDVKALRSEIQPFLGQGLVMKTTTLGATALRRRAELMVRSDLRARDHETDLVASSEASLSVGGWAFPELARGSRLRARFREIRRFVDVCKSLGDTAWQWPPPRLFACTRPPSYFDVARRLLYRTETKGFSPETFDELLSVVNAIRGTEYRDSVGQYVDPDTVAIPWHDQSLGPELPTASRLILGNVPLRKHYWTGAATRLPGSSIGSPVHSLQRLKDLSRILEKASSAARYLSGEAKVPSLLVLPELALPRKWFRAVAEHVVRAGRFGMIVGLEYSHDLVDPYVRNQVFSVLPGPFSSVATWPWTKRNPAREEQSQLTKLRPSVGYPPVRGQPRRRVAISSGVGRFSVLICSELIEAKQVGDLVGRVELVACPSWNQDTASYDHLIQSAGLQLHAFVAIANNGVYSDCRAWAPYSDRWRRDVCRLVERGMADVVFVDIPIGAIRAFHQGIVPSRGEPKWRPLPPDWPASH